MAGRAISRGGMPAGYPYRGLYMNFVRLLDQSVHEYDAARDEWITFLTPETHDGPRRGNAPCGDFDLG